MIIKHLPSGLFPNFNSGIERSPLYPLQGEGFTIGCRLLDGTKDTKIFLSWKLDGIEMPPISGKQTVPNDINHEFFTFEVVIPQEARYVEYMFIARNKINEYISKTYQFELLEKINLKEPIGFYYDDNEISALYEHDGAKYQLNIKISNKIKISIRTHYGSELFDGNTFIEKEYKLSNRYKVIIKSPFKLSIYDDDKKIAEYNPFIQMKIDRHKKVYELVTVLNVNSTAFYGFGEKFDGVNQIGKAPLSYIIEKFCDQKENTYIPIPFFFTDKNIGYFQSGTWRTQFFLEQQFMDNWNEVIIKSRCQREGVLFECFIFAGAPDELLREYTNLTGKPILPPKWVFGPFISSNGWNTQKEALEQVKYLNMHKIPATVMVLEAWSDEETFYIWNDAVYKPLESGLEVSYNDFKFQSDGKWPNPKAFIKELHSNGLELILWQIPVIKYVEGEHGEQLKLDTKYAIDNKLCIQNEDGSPYRITDLWFGNSLIPDFTNPETTKWWFAKRKYLIEELGIAGFKTDGGEFLFDETSKLYDGRTIEEAHNAYPNIYEGAYHDFMKQMNHNGITFSRAGYSGAQKYPVHWAGDQISSFSELRGQLSAGLSLGLSGVIFWGFDIGGFSGELPSTELYLRSTALAAFTPIMQFHSEPRNGQYYMTESEYANNDRSPWNIALAKNDNLVIPVYRQFANLRMNMMPYLWQEAKHCVDTSRPMMAHFIYDFSNDMKINKTQDEYMFGRNLLIAPIIFENASGRIIRLPEGIWYDFWTGKKNYGNTQFYYECDLLKIPVFVREGTVLPLNINNNMVVGGTETCAYISNNINQYENLCLFIYGDCCIDFSDDFGADIHVEVIQGNCIITGMLPDKLLVTSAINDGLRNITVNGKITSTIQKTITMFKRKLQGYQII